jgi:hypothetical protein
MMAAQQLGSDIGREFGWGQSSVASFCDDGNEPLGPVIDFLEDSFPVNGSGFLLWKDQEVTCFLANWD